MNVPRVRYTSPLHLCSVRWVFVLWQQRKVTCLFCRSRLSVKGLFKLKKKNVELCVLINTCLCCFLWFIHWDNFRKIKKWRISLVSHVSSSHTWMPLPHVNALSTCECPFHTWMPLSHVNSSNMWMPIPHVSSSHTWILLSHMSSSHTWMPLPHMSSSHTWMPPPPCILVPCMWAVRDSHVCALLPSTFQKKWPKNRPSTTMNSM